MKEPKKETNLRKGKTNSISLLLDIGKTLTSSLNLSEILHRILEKVGLLLSPKNWSLLLVNQEEGTLNFEIVVGENADEIKSMKLKIGEGIAGYVAKSGEPLIIADVRKDKRFSPKADEITNFFTKSVICVPLKSKGNILGVIELINKDQGGKFDRKDLEILEALADFAAIAIENARYVEKIENLAIIDDHTQLYNARYFHTSLDYHLKLTERYGGNLSLIFIDLDHFKDVNDRFGHLIGSKLLREVADVFKECIRKTDIPIRYGGDEYVIILPNTSRDQACLIANRLKTTLYKTLFLTKEEIYINLSASFGIATFPDHAQSKVELIRKADNAMYLAKEKGRNAIELAQNS